MNEERLPRKILEVSIWKTKKGKTSKFVDARGYNRNEKERGIGDLECGVKIV